MGENGSSVLDDYRTSYGTFLNRLAALTAYIQHTALQRSCRHLVLLHDLLHL